MTCLPALPLLLATTRMSTKWLCFLNYFRSFIAFTGQSTIQFHWSEKKFFQWYRREKVCCIQRDSSHAKKLRLKFIIKSLSTRLPRFMQANRKWDNMSFSHCSCHTWPSCFVTEGCHSILKRLSTRLPTRPTSEFTWVFRIAHVTRPSCLVTDRCKAVFAPVQIRHDPQNF